MKKKVLLKVIVYSVLSLCSCSLLLIVYCFCNLNVLSVDTIPQIEKFDITIYKIDKYKVWEMKNVYLYNGDYTFDVAEDGKLIDNRFFMVNKKIYDVDGFSNQFMNAVNSERNEHVEKLIKFHFYLESENLPKYWRPVWNKRSKDELSDHKEDLLFIITTDNNLNILNIDTISTVNKERGGGCTVQLTKSRWRSMWGRMMMRFETQ